MIHTYRAAVQGFAPVATPPDVFVLKAATATGFFRVKKIRLVGVATGQGNMPVQIIRRSTAGTLGSAILSPVTAASMDKNADAPQGGVWSVGTANYTSLGTSVGIVDAARINMPPVTTGQMTELLMFDFASMPLYVRGSSDFLCVNLAGATVPAGGLIDAMFEWEEG